MPFFKRNPYISLSLFFVSAWVQAEILPSACTLHSATSRCLATVYDSNTLLTARHCMDSPFHTIQCVGPEGRDFISSFEIQGITKLPQAVPAPQSYAHWDSDLGLISINRPIRLMPQARPVSVAEFFDGGRHEAIDGPSFTFLFHHASSQFPLRPHVECALLTQDFILKTYTNAHIRLVQWVRQGLEPLFYIVARPQDPAQPLPVSSRPGDSGGPLLCRHQGSTLWQQIGVTSALITVNNQFRVVNIFAVAL